MHKFKKMSIVMACVLILSGCGNQKASRISGGNNVDQVLNSQVAADNNKSSGDKSKVSDENLGERVESQSETAAQEKMGNKKDANASADSTKLPEPADTDVEIDLTVMDRDMVYATVYQLVFNSEDYIGKTVRMRGNYVATWYERTQQYYHAVIIQDATACCSQGLEFIWGDGSHIYPDEYPKDDTDVEVVGEFETYMEDGYEYCRINNASLKVVEES